MSIKINVSYLNMGNKVFDLPLNSNTTVDELKKMIERRINIPTEKQFWLCNSNVINSPDKQIVKKEDIFNVIVDTFHD